MWWKVPVKRTYFVYLLLCAALISVLLLAQSNPPPLVNQPNVISPIGREVLLRRDKATEVKATAKHRDTSQSPGLDFAPAVTYDSGGYSTQNEVTVADVNGDGKPDLVVTNQCISSSDCDNGTVGVLLGNGDGTFQTAVTYRSGGWAASSVAVADVNGDGKPDIVVTNFCATSSNCDNGTVGVLLGNGDGTFQTSMTYGSGGYDVGSFVIASVAVADVNGDGKPDIVVTNFCATSSNCNDGTVSVLLGNGDGTFQKAVTYDSGGSDADSVAVADVNGDGKPDLVVANFCMSSSNCNTGTVSVLLGNGDGTFQTPMTYSSGGANALSVVVADVNGDGKPDLVVVNQSGNGNFGRVGVLLGNGDGTFQTAVTYGSGGYGSWSVAVGDVNGDGKPDIVVTSCTPSSYCGSVEGVVGVLLGNGDGTFQTAVTYGSGALAAAWVAIKDVNEDGKPDLIVANSCFNSGGKCTKPTIGVLINISGAVTTTELVSSIDPSNFGQAVTFISTVTSQGSGTPTGTVTFTYGSTTLCNAVTLSGGTATCAYSALPVGSDTVTATYSGDSNFSGSSASVNQTVNQASTTLTLISSLNPSGLDSPVTFTATITPLYGGQATGTVTFKDGGTTLGSSGVSGNAASLTTSGLAMGTHSITAVYSGDSNFAGSTSNTLTQVVTKATTTTTLASSVNPSVQGKPVTFTALVSSLAGTPTGKIQFLNGTKVLATLKLTSGSAKYTTSKLPPGANIVTAVYKGDSNNNGSTSAPVDQFVLAATTTTLKSSPNPSKYGEAVTFTAVVSSSIGAPPDGETISFMKGKTLLGTGSLSDGSASFTTSTLKVGTTSVDAVYGGDSNFAGSKSNVVKQVVEKATD
jgi:hypothetical protein